MVTISKFDGLLISPVAMAGLSGGWLNQLLGVKIAVLGDSSLRAEYAVAFEEKGAVMQRIPLGDVPTALAKGTLDLAFLIGHEIRSDIVRFFLESGYNLFLYDAQPGGILDVYDQPTLIQGTPGNDLIHSVPRNTEIEGYNGLDTVIFSSNIGSHSVSFGSEMLRIAKPDGSFDQLSSIERIQFTDTTLAFDEGAGQVYRLYQAAFSRTPDKGGLSYWV